MEEAIAKETVKFVTVICNRPFYRKIWKNYNKYILQFSVK